MFGQILVIMFGFGYIFVDSPQNHKYNKRIEHPLKKIHHSKSSSLQHLSKQLFDSHHIYLLHNNAIPRFQNIFVASIGKLSKLSIVQNRHPPGSKTLQFYGTILGLRLQYQLRVKCYDNSKRIALNKTSVKLDTQLSQILGDALKYFR
eukprot:TRINITY_DN6716_c0_g1_i1.p1 TRINITY_DN6716_c0_g1~~TRINITY_DN6716_c0_g1_i1.p1  ORF type:complete len:156 (+),score=0.04 TRINITY_DN6716_c0_g1_i1:26-469(+)